MCDFSLDSLHSRPAQVGDKLVTHNFGTGTRGLAAVDDFNLAVFLMPGTELAFSSEVTIRPFGLLGWERKTINHRTAIFRQVNKEKPAAHHDALEFPDGRIELLTILYDGQAATVLQLPAQATITAEADAHRRRGTGRAIITLWRRRPFRFLRRRTSLQPRAFRRAAATVGTPLIEKAGNNRDAKVVAVQNNNRLLCVPETLSALST